MSTRAGWEVLEGEYMIGVEGEYPSRVGGPGG